MTDKEGKTPAGETAPPPDLGPLVPPLAGWPNDDLLFSQPHRDFLTAHHPKAAPIFDWPELRARFAAHDPRAGRFRKRSRRLGVLAVLLGCASLVITAIIGLLKGPPELARALGALAAILALASGATGFGGVLRGRDKWRWLAHRFWTERMRQLHFQLIVNNLPLAARAMAEAAATEEWLALRARALARFEHLYMAPLADNLALMRGDLAVDQPWLEKDWAPPPAPPSASPQLIELFSIMKQQRFGIQARYARLKLHRGAHSPKSRAWAMRLFADALTATALLCSAAAGVYYVTAADSPVLPMLLAGGAVLAALVLALRVLDEGLQLRSETERYEWYLAAVEALERRYDAAPDDGKPEILREMERLSYQELRWFVVSFGEARFVL